MQTTTSTFPIPTLPTGLLSWPWAALFRSRRLAPYLNRRLLSPSLRVPARGWPLRGHPRSTGLERESNERFISEDDFLAFCRARELRLSSLSRTSLSA